MTYVFVIIIVVVNCARFSGQVYWKVGLLRRQKNGPHHVCDVRLPITAVKPGSICLTGRTAGETHKVEIGPEFASIVQILLKSVGMEKAHGVIH